MENEMEQNRRMTALSERLGHLWSDRIIAVLDNVVTEEKLKDWNGKKNQYDKNFVLTLSPTCIEDVRIPVGSTPTPSPSQSGGAPGISEEVLDGLCYRPLLQAAFEGDWEFAKSFFQQDPASETVVITSRSETVLHIAALNAQDQFVENMVKLLSQRLDVLKTEDCNGRAALHNAALCGRIRMVKALVKSNPALTQIPDKEGRVPFNISTREASMHKEIAWFLAQNTTDEGPGHPFSSPHAIESIIGLTYAGHHDIVLYLVERYPRFLLMKGPRETDCTILGVLARMQSHFLSGTRLNVWEALIYKCIPVDLTHKPTDENSRIMQTLTNPGGYAFLQSGII
ncbi:uncharacterized protein LOC104439974 [Eucalyptus grandis]|uniref:uncharacterized protein LOC104439974 n=1 Tax=Eucalyptus grandis TaxID=71139 RepID=UPI00192ED7D0|nr:uncharacterized protein LOC104439974 [Eucalyptus grandis]